MLVRSDQNPMFGANRLSIGCCAMELWRSYGATWIIFGQLAPMKNQAFGGS